MSFSSNLNVHVPWLRLADLLDLPVSSQLLPAVTRCPLCTRHRLTIWEDRVCKGQWFHCRDCQKSGDLIQLAAKTWDLSLAATIAKLARNDFDVSTDKELVRRYLHDLVERRRRGAVFWKEARHRPFHSSTTAGRLIQELRLSCDVSAERAESGPKRLIGLATVQEVEMLRAVHAKAEPSYRRVFQGQHWDDVLVVPFRDLPQRICGFLCVGRNGDLTKDVAYQSLALHGAGNPGFETACEGGLAMHPEALDLAEAWDNTVLITDNAVRMLQLQFRHFEQSTQPLPIAAWHYGQSKAAGVRTRHAWQMLAGKTLVFWMPFPSAEVLSQAIAQNGRLCTHGPLSNDADGWRCYLNKMSSRDLFKRLVGGSKPWAEIVADLAVNAADNVLEELFAQLEIHGVALDRVLKICPSAAKKRIVTILARSGKGATISMNGLEIFEQEDAWWVTLKGRQELVFDAVLQITEVIQHSQSKKIY
jgi:hypothetical protein